MKYPSDLTTKQWQIIKPLFSGENRGAHFAKHSKRKLVNAVLYMEKTGCQWRQLPHDFPKWSTVKSFYYRAVASGLWEKMRALLVEKSRVDTGRKSEPTYGVIDSQSTKTMYGADERGIDGGKKQKAGKGIS
ncbi:transposase [Ruminococcaceae bacterium OttesenSCG-928-L11]|nr:transposase [Ruminococcaceae bacterium OttesenSCG-928-L11]